MTKYDSLLINFNTHLIIPKLYKIHPSIHKSISYIYINHHKPPEIMKTDTTPTPTKTPQPGQYF